MNASSDLQWQKSSFSGIEGNCVEVALGSVGVLVRDSKYPAGPVLALPVGAWRDLISARR